MDLREDDEETPDSEPKDENAMDQDSKPDEEGNNIPSSEPKPRQPKPSQMEFEIYSDDELQAQDRNILVADVANLEGTFCLSLSRTQSCSLRLTSPQSRKQNA